MPQRSTKRDLPSTIERSEKHAQETYIKAHDSAVETYGEGERAHRTAYSALKHSYKKQGDKWVPKDKKGPSDPQAARSQTTSRKSTDRPAAATGGGKEVPLDEWNRDDLYNYAQDLDIKGRSQMTKAELVKAIKSAK